MKPSKTITEIEEDIRRITVFVSDLLGKPSLGQQWMKDGRFEKDKSAIEMIHEGNLGDVMIRIHDEFFNKTIHSK